MVDYALLEHCLPGGFKQAGGAHHGGAAALEGGYYQLPGGQGGSIWKPKQSSRSFRGTRKIPLSREIYIEQDDFMEDPPKKFFRLAPGREVRLRFAYFIKCTDVIMTQAGI